MSQSRFSIVLVGVSALLRRPLISRLRPAAFTARGSGGFRRSALPSVSALPSPGWPSGSRLPLFGMRRFGVALGELVLPQGELAFGLTASAFRHAPLRGCPRRVGLRAYGFRFSACTVSELPLGGLVLPPSASEIAVRRVGLRASASGIAAGRVGLRAHGFRFSACAASEIALGGLILPLGGLVFGLTASAFRHAPLRSGRWAGWPSDSPLPLFGTRRSAPPHRRSEDRRSTTTRHLFHFKTLIPTC